MFPHNISISMAPEQLEQQEIDYESILQPSNKEQPSRSIGYNSDQYSKLPSNSLIDNKMQHLKASIRLSDESDGKNLEHTRLPNNFRPGPYDVICGRGKIVSNYPGNRRYRDLIQASLGQYIISSTKVEKTLLVTSIIKLIEDSSPNGGFIKRINGVWHKVSNSYAREKCGQSIRDALHTEYKSSSRAKAWRRRVSNHEVTPRQRRIQDNIDERIGISFNELCSDMKESSTSNKEEMMNHLQLGRNVSCNETIHPCGISPVSMRQNSSLNHIFSNYTANLSYNNIADYSGKLSATIISPNFGKNHSMSSFVSQNFLSKRSSLGYNQNFGYTGEIGPHEIDDPEGLDFMVRTIFQDVEN